jgi:hypothetical protein
MNLRRATSSSYCNILRTEMECKATVQCAVLNWGALFLPTEIYFTALRFISREMSFGPDIFVLPDAA